jgi:hydrogenase expression/formation protein HypE
LIELALSSKNDFLVCHDNIPVKKETRAICDFLGMDPLYIANEGKMAIFVEATDADKVLKTIRNNRYGHDASIIGEVLKKGNGTVILKTEIGTRRTLDMYYSEQLPRIC